MKKRLSARLAALAFWIAASSAWRAAAGAPDLRQLALDRPNEAQAALAALPAAERVEVLRDLLRSPKPPVRVLAARVGRSTFELRLLNDLAKALAREDDSNTSTALSQALQYLCLYEKIALPEEDLAALFPAGPGPEEKTQPEDLGPVAMKLTVLNRDGDPVAGARALAYMRDLPLRSPVADFAQADDKGRATLNLARGVWTIVAFGPETYQAAHAGRGVFIVAKDRRLEKEEEALVLRPDAELRIEIQGEQAGDADAVHILDRPQGQQIAFPSLGSSRGGRFVVEATAGHPLAALAVRRMHGKTGWVAFLAEAQAPGLAQCDPLGAEAARIRLAGPSLLPKVDSATVSLRQFAHDATPATLEVASGQTLYASPGTVEIDYAVVSGRQRFVYSPESHRLKPGQTISLILDSPSTATVFQQIYAGFYGKKNVLAIGLLGRDANGHVLTALQRKDGQAVPLPVRVRLNGESLAESAGANGAFFREVKDGVEPKRAGDLRYEIGEALGPGVPRELPGADWTSLETEHFTFHAAPALSQRVKQLAEGTERLYSVIRELGGEEPKWKRTGIFLRAILPPTVGGSSSAEGIRLPTARFLKARWLERQSMAPLPHEMLHKFGLGHDDFMDVWQSEVWRHLQESQTPTLAIALKPQAQQTILAFLTGEPGSGAAKALPWAVLGRYGLGPFQGYQKVERSWKPPLQADGLSDDETYCAILGEMAHADLRELYAAAGLSIRPEAYEAAMEKIAALRAGAAAEASATLEAGSKPAAPSDPTDRINRALASALKKGGPEGAQMLRAALPMTRDLPLNRARVRTYMRFGKAFDDLDSMDEAYAAYREAQREAAKVSRAYLDLCRRISLDALMGKPLMLGHM